MAAACIKALVVALLLIAGVAIDGANGAATVTGTVFCDQCKDGYITLFDYPLSGANVVMLCPGANGAMQTIGQETTNMLGTYTMKFDGTPDLSSCITQVTSTNQQSSYSSNCLASAGPSKSLQLTLSMFGMEFYAVDPLISEPAQPMSFCLTSGGRNPFPFPFPSPSHPVVSPTPPARLPSPSPSSSSPPVFKLPPLPPLPSLPPLPLLEASACSHEYWMMPEYKCYWRVVSPDTTVALLFGPLAARKYGPDMTLWTGLQGRGEPYRTLLRESITALLNSYNSLQFPYSSIGVVQHFNLAMMSSSPRRVLLAALRFKRANSGSGNNSSCKFQDCK